MIILLLTSLLLFTHIVNAQLFLTFSFDDNLIEHYDAALILEQHGMKGTFYVNSARLSTTSTYLSENSVIELQNRGHEIGGHTINHRNLLQSNNTVRIRQICQDKQNLEQLGLNISSFAFPFGADFEGANTIFNSCNYVNARDSGGIRTPISCNGCPTFLSLPLQDPFAIRSISYRINEGNDIIFDIINKALQDTQAQKRFGWIILIFHEIGDLPNNPTSITWELFESLIEFVEKKRNISVVNTDELVKNDVDYQELYTRNLIAPTETSTTETSTTETSTTETSTTETSTTKTSTTETSTTETSTTETSTTETSITETSTNPPSTDFSQLSGVVGAAIAIGLFIVLAIIHMCYSSCGINCGDFCGSCWSAITTFMCLRTPAPAHAPAHAPAPVSPQNLNDNVSLENVALEKFDLDHTTLDEQFKMTAVMV